MKTKVTRAVLWGIVLGISGLLAAGCYTVLVHPQVQVTGEDNSVKTCADCHSSTDYYYWHFPYQYNWYSHNSYWSRYYYNPWWYDNYWYWNGRDHGEGTGGPTGHLWQPMVPPSSGSQPAISPGTSGGAKDTGKSSGQNDQGGNQQGDSSKGHLFQPMVPPKDTGGGKSNDSNKQDGSTKPDDSSGKKAEEQK